MTAALTIRQAAARTKLSVHTLRYYERIGLIHPVPRQGNGHRRYRAEDMGWIAFLLRLRATGMSVEQMQHYARLRDAGATPASVAGRKRLLQAHAARVEAELDALRENLDCLRQKLSLYEDLERQLTGEEHEHDRIGTV